MGRGGSAKALALDARRRLVRFEDPVAADVPAASNQRVSICRGKSPVMQRLALCGQARRMRDIAREVPEAGVAKRGHGD